jgi:hypothetical protein
MAVYLAQLWENDKTSVTKPVICMIADEEMVNVKKRIHGKIKQRSR